MIRIPLTDIPCPGTYEIEGASANRPGIFIVRHPQGVSAFRNSCPHTGAPLNWQPNQFLNDDGLIQCSLHGALFLPSSGFCISGPCRNQSLTPVPITLEDGVITIEATP
jgi:nitrite reductase/ring-hydroxylating ferredoxin subunit